MKNQHELLQQRIHALELQQESHRIGIKLGFNDLLESISPINFIKRSLHNMTSEPDVKTDLLNGVAGLASGYLSNKIGLFGLAKGPIKSLVHFLGKKLF